MSELPKEEKCYEIPFIVWVTGDCETRDLLDIEDEEGDPLFFQRIKLPFIGKGLLDAIEIGVDRLSFDENIIDKLFRQISFDRWEVKADYAALKEEWPGFFDEKDNEEIKGKPYEDYLVSIGVKP